MSNEFETFGVEYLRNHYPSIDQSSRRHFDRIEISCDMRDSRNEADLYDEFEGGDAPAEAMRKVEYHLQYPIRGSWTEPWATEENYEEYFRRFRAALLERWPEAAHIDHDLESDGGTQFITVTMWLP